MSWLGIPLQVADAVRDTFGVGLEPSQVYFFPKSAIGRGEAWKIVQEKAPTTVVRKCHTDGYWVWFDTKVENPHAKAAYEAKRARESAGT